MKLPYDLQQLYIKMLSNNFTNHQVTLDHKQRIIEIIYTAPDEERYESDFGFSGSIEMYINVCLGDGRLAGEPAPPHREWLLHK